jgi:threonine synthase
MKIPLSLFNAGRLRYPTPNMFLSQLTCTSCGLHHEWNFLQNLCTRCQKPLFPTYDLEAARRALTREALAIRPEKSLWRYRELLPLPAEVEPISLGEGGTPLPRARRFGEQFGMADLWIKDESVNPTQSFKARGMSVAVSMAKYLGARKLALPSAGNAPIANR